MPNTDIAKHNGLATVAVIDIGKTNIKLSAVTAQGKVLETYSITNTTLPAPPWRHHDLAGIGAWICETLAILCRQHQAIERIVTSGHGSSGILVGDLDNPADPELSTGAVLPMIDYEQTVPVEINDHYAALAGDYFDRGSAIMMGATHQARQLYWMEKTHPKQFQNAKWFLGMPQYWGWRLGGAAVSEVTYLGAQSQLWNTVRKSWSPIVAHQKWEHLMAPFAPAWQVIGRIQPELAKRFNFPKPLEILAGIHDSSANFYRYQAAGWGDATVISTGTWIVGLSRNTPPEDLKEHHGMTLNADVFGRPIGGVLTMGGKEYAHLMALEQAPHMPASPRQLSAIIKGGIMALPSFGKEEGLFPGSAGNGRITNLVNSLSKEPGFYSSLAVLYAALLTVECLDALKCHDRVVLDGSFLNDPLYASLVAAMRPDAGTFYNLDTYGVASGAALLATHEQTSSQPQVSLQQPEQFACPELIAYARKWRQQAHTKPDNT
ncbi:FGGY family carbohydrate kinase [Thalassospira marina]|uniref:Carbohydrate kinase n=1 Tax=Thalassospira marina TaxID=2048283 RepID=A0ABN5FQ88_9PROT|nr:FGGY family carbohydrate kinase [Thalassospira marina]AUG55627.1 carbohydrate kinase [Thalassospira marina]